MRSLFFILVLSFSSLCQLLAQQQDTTQVAIDSTVVEAVKEKGEEILKDSLNNYLPATTIDSTEIANKAKSVAAETINNETGVNLNGIPKDSTEIANQAKQLTNEELSKAGIEVSGIPTDSAAVKSEAKQLAKDQFKDYTGEELPDITIDSTTATQVKEEAAKRAEAAIKDTDHMKALEGTDSELGKLTDTKEQVEKTAAELREMKARKQMKQKMAGHAKEFIQENAEQIQQVQSKMGELKQKYSSVVNSNDLSTATKRSSLKGEPFWKRLVIGGNLNLSETNPLSIDFAPVLGWKFNKLFEAGVTGAYRAKFGADKSGVNTFENEEVYGYSIFANHMVFKNFFGYLEGENMSTVTGTTEDSQRAWQQSLLLGLGRKFKIAKFLEMQAIVSYNFLHDNSDGVYNSPVVFKTGLRVVK